MELTRNCYGYAMDEQSRGGYVADMAEEMNTDLGPHSVTTFGTTQECQTLAAALKEFDDAARWARGHRWMTNLTTGKTVARG